MDVTLSQLEVGTIMNIDSLDLGLGTGAWLGRRLGVPRRFLGAIKCRWPLLASHAEQQQQQQQQVLLHQEVVTIEFLS